MSLTVLNPRIHLVKDTSTARFFRRKLGESDVMTFWHSETGMWILAFWVHRGKRIVEELEDLGPNCEAVTPAFVKMIVESYGPVDFRKKKKHLLSRQKSRIQKQTDDIIEYQSKWSWLKTRTKETAPLPYAYSTPMSGGKVLSATGGG